MLGLLTGLSGNPVGGAPPPAYTIDKSLRFNDDDSAYLARTASGSGSRILWTISTWAKRGNLGLTASIFGCGTTSSDTDYLSLIFNSSDQLAISGGTTSWRITSQVFRDPAAWYHIVVAADTANATANNRIRLYINGLEVTAFGTLNNPSSSANLGWNQNAANHIGRRGSGANYFDGLLADFKFIDGQALTPTSFGEFDSTTGVWKPKAYSGAYGTDGFWLSFANASSTTTIGYDDAGGAAGAGAGSNDWTANNLSVTAGVGNDSSLDTPTNNVCTWNHLQKNLTNPTGFANANQDLSFPSTNYGMTIATMGITSGKWYWEITPSSVTGSTGLGIAKDPLDQTKFLGNDANGWSYFSSGNAYHNSGSGVAYGASYTNGDVIGVAFDADNGRIFFSKNGAWQNSGDPVAGTGYAFNTLTSGPYYPAASDGSNSSASAIAVNFGQRAFASTPPTGFVALTAANLATPAIVKPSAQVNAVTYTGNASARSITGMGHQPDLLWFKNRGASASHILVDSVRGSGWEVQLDTSDDANSARVSSLDSDGWTFVSNSAASLNANTNTYVAWSWKKGITPGFDIVTYTGTGSNRTIAHSLGVAPKFLMIKDRNGAASNNWFAWHINLTSGAYRIIPNTTAAQDNAPTMMNSTAPTSSVFSVGTAGSTNVNAKNYVAWLWAEVQGFSRFGSYVGNSNADGTFSWCGFRPRFVMIKRIDTTADWQIFDSVRTPTNMISTTLAPNSTAAESSFAAGYDIDFLSNGFKPKVSSAAINNSAGTYVFAAFAENPFKYALAR